MSKQAPALGFDESDLRQFKLLVHFRRALEEVVAEKGLSSTWTHPRRKLALGDYLSLYLFAMLNPVLDSMRGACAASRMERVSNQVSSGPVSLGSFSEAQHLVDEALLGKVFERLKGQLPPRSKRDVVARLKGLQVCLIDSSVWSVCNRLSWALWRPVSGGGNTTSDSAVRLHTVFDLSRGVVDRAELTAAKFCERKAWKQLAQPGSLYVGDRYYSYNYALLGQMSQRQVHFLVRSRVTTQWVVQEQFEPDEAARQAGVFYWANVRLGVKGDGPAVTVVKVQTEKQELTLLTNLPPQALSPAELAALYKERWQIECFFHWLKCIFKNRHWFCESQHGMQVQVYIALIAATLLVLYTGKRPNKRCMETIQMFLNGWCSAQELPALLKAYVK